MQATIRNSGRILTDISWQSGGGKRAARSLRLEFVIGTTRGITLTESNQAPQAIRQPGMTLRRALSRTLAAVILVAVVAAIGAATTYFWFNSDRLLEASSSHEVAPAPVIDPEVTATLKDIQSLQQHTAAVLDALVEGAAAQQADLKRLSGQLSILAERVDALQNPAVPPAPLAVSESTASVRAAVPPNKKRSHPSKPEGPVSVGGAPLSPSAQ